MWTRDASCLARHQRSVECSQPCPRQRPGANRRIVTAVWQMQFDTTEWPEYYRHLIQLAQSEPRLAAQAAEWIALAHVFLVLGTSSVVYPAAGLPRIALERAPPVRTINLDPTEVSLGR